jgi:hypothetical protein
LNGGTMGSDIQEIDTEEFVEFPFLIHNKFLKNGSIEFTLKLHDVIGAGQFIDNKGKTGWRRSLRLHSLTISKPIDGNDYIELKHSKK